MNKKHIIITGGTSGLGKAIAEIFINSGFDVYVLGRTDHSELGALKNYHFYACDFADFNSVKKVVEQLVRLNTNFDVLVNNAGILSPPSFQETKDGYELTYQVNFLSHVLLTNLLIKHQVLDQTIIVNLSSPIYPKGNLDVESIFKKESYNIIKAYASTKFYMALFSKWLVARGYESFSFNPGTFRSGIYRSQKQWFHRLYKIGAPFLIPASRVANGLTKIIFSETWQSGTMMNRRGQFKEIESGGLNDSSVFWQLVDKQLGEYIE